MAVNDKGAASRIAIEVATHGLFAGLFVSGWLRDAAAVSLLALLILDREGAWQPRAGWRWAIVAFLATTGISTALADDPLDRLDLLRFYPYGVLVFCGVHATSRFGGARRFAATAAAVVAVFGWDGVLQAVFDTTLVHTRSEIWGRTTGSFLFPSDASLLAVLLPLALRVERIGAAALWGLVVLPAGATILLSGTRTAWAAGALALGIHFAPRVPRRRLVAAAVAFAAASAMFAAFVPGSAPDRLLSADVWRDEKRASHWRATVALIAERPWLGHGPHSFQRALDERWGTDPVFTAVDRKWAPHPHQIHLERLHDTGVFGFAAWVALLGISAAVRFGRGRGDEMAAAGFESVLLLALVGFVDHSLGKDWVQACLWAGLGLTAAARSGAGRRPPAPHSPPK